MDSGAIECASGDQPVKRCINLKKELPCMLTTLRLQSLGIKLLSIVAPFLLLLLAGGRAHAEIVSFSDELIYQAEDFDNMQTSRVIAFAKVKNRMQEHYVKYLLTTYAPVNMRFDKDQISFFITVILRTEVIDEQWDGHSYRIDARVSADPADIVTKINLIRGDKQKMQDLKTIRGIMATAIASFDKIKKELGAAEPGSGRHSFLQKDYLAALKRIAGINWFYDGFSRQLDSKINEALDAYSRGIESDELNVYAYYYRSKVFDGLGDYRQALDSLNKVIEVEPKFQLAYTYRANIYFMVFKDYARAISDYAKALELNPADDGAYYGRGLMFATRMKKYKEAIADFTKVIELNPKNAQAYYYRGMSYGYLGDYVRRGEDYKVSAELGHPNAIEYMNRK
ncbi:tetratricopeptide repeat protein [bacterium]|nr:MAG: tetratricopeptide repeat protein [bacterium]